MSLLLFFFSGQNRILSIKRTILCQLYNTTIKIEYCDFMFPCGGTFIAEKRVNEIHKVIHFDNSIYASYRKNVILALHPTVFFHIIRLFARVRCISPLNVLTHASEHVLLKDTYFCAGIVKLLAIIRLFSSIGFQSTFFSNYFKCLMYC